ncbi:OmpA family protein [Lutibacter sp. HS1-25]|uniref:OmpA family protein n=1 Tax=Lutibacter sp. HS1-25 TaxID=2485000 RepID=UPI00101092A6|nr:OmpA family protein [Lutibacter sp. HS1-25]RXP61934.1 OmpA family protein [Lutibacter sp. HS1-25]
MNSKYLVFFMLFTLSLFAQKQEVKIFNTAVNTVDAEFGITYLNSNTVIYVSSKKVENDKVFSKDRRARNHQMFLEFYQGTITSNGDIIENGKISANSKSEIFESDIAFTPDGKTIYFTWNNFYNNDISRRDSARFQSLKLAKASINERFEISNISFLPFNNNSYSLRYPAIGKNGKQLFFASDMPGGFGGNDIYVVDILPNNTYSEPKNLGSNINTKEDEIFPFIDQNNALYFASYGHNGLGNYDIFKSDFVEGKYQSVENLPAPINSKYDDFNYIINNLTNTGYFSSNRKEGKGDVDIYAFKIIDEQCMQNISGIVSNESDNNPITEATVSLYVKNELIESQIVKTDSKYNFKVPCNEAYKLVVEKEEFKPIEINLLANNTSNEINIQNIALTPIHCYHSISGFVFNEKSNKQLAQVTVNLFLNGVLETSQLTQVGSKFSFIIKCEDNYKIVAEKDGFLPSEIDVITNNKPYFLEDINLFLTPKDCNQTIAGQLFDQKTKQQLTNVQISLFVNDVLTETLLLKDSNYLIDIDCETTYKILAEKEGYLPAEANILTSNKPEFKNNTDLYLVPVECKQTIVAQVIDQKTKQQLSNVQFSLFVNDVLTDTQITSNNTHTFNVDCETAYKIMAQKEGYLPAEVVLLTNNNANFENAININLSPVECKQTIVALVIDDKTKQQLSNVQFSLFVNDVLTETQITSNNTHTFNVNCETSYKIMAQKEGYLPAEVVLLTNNNANFENAININLNPIECNQTIAGAVFNSKNNEKLNNVKISLYVNDVLTETQITSNNAYTFNVDCETAYKIMATKEGFTNSTIVLNTNNKNNFNNVKNINLEPVVEFIAVNNEKMIKTDVIYFDLDSDEISEAAEIEINKVIGILKKYPTMKIEIASHTDSRAPDNYNLILSEKRASSTSNYMIEQGIDANRIKAKGYGETKLINKCANGVPCTNAEHELNRRTEFVIIQE